MSLYGKLYDMFSIIAICTSEIYPANLSRFLSSSSKIPLVAFGYLSSISCVFSFFAGCFNRLLAFRRKASYSFSSRWIFRSSACSAVLRAVSSFSSAFSFSAEGSLVSPAFLISLAAASNKMISLSKPRRNFSLSFDALYRS